MNQRLISIARRSISFALLLFGQVAVALPLAWGQPAVVIPPGDATPTAPPGRAANAAPNSPYYNVKGVDDHLRMVVNSSRFLTLDKKIPQVQVNNPDVLDVVPISPNQVQISAKRTGVTQVNLWGDDKRIYTVNVIVTGDAAELTQVLRDLFPKTTLTIVPVNGSSVIISGYVDQQDAVPKIVSVATKYFPEVINNMIVSGVQQGILHVKVYEVSRTKLRDMGVDWAVINASNGSFVFSGLNNLLSNTGGSLTAPSNTLNFGIKGTSNFYAVLNALRQDSLAKLDSEPDLVAISGRPSYVLVGGELGYQYNGGINGPVVGFKEYGTRLDFLPIILGNGRMHIDLRTRVSEPDEANSINGIPALKTREVETGVELHAGETLAIAGMIETRTEASSSGIPWVSEIPYLGLPFRNVKHSTNEVELLVLVTPELVDGMQPGQVPTCLPGMQTASPSDWELFFKGHLEVPNCCPSDATACTNCAAGTTNGGLIPIEGHTSQQNPQERPAANQVAMNSRPPEPGFIGPIGYDVLK